jgi:hypothetical protein
VETRIEDISSDWTVSLRHSPNLVYWLPLLDSSGLSLTILLGQKDFAPN